MCRKRLTALETVTLAHEARLLELRAESERAIHGLETLRSEVKADLADLRHELRITIDVVRTEVLESRKEASREIASLATSNNRIEMLLERVLQAASQTKGGPVGA